MSFNSGVIEQEKGQPQLASKSSNHESQKENEWTKMTSGTTRSTPDTAPPTDFLALPLEKAKKSRFPEGCLVEYVSLRVPLTEKFPASHHHDNSSSNNNNNNHNHRTFSPVEKDDISISSSHDGLIEGVVIQVGIDLASSTTKRCYNIRLQDGKEVILPEDCLFFGARQPVWLLETCSDSSQEPQNTIGVVWGSKADLSFQNILYKVETPENQEGNWVPSDAIRFRSTQEDMHGKSQLEFPPKANPGTTSYKTNAGCKHYMMQQLAVKVEDATVVDHTSISLNKATTSLDDAPTQTMTVMTSTEEDISSLLSTDERSYEFCQERHKTGRASPPTTATTFKSSFNTIPIKGPAAAITSASLVAPTRDTNMPKGVYGLSGNGERRPSSNKINSQPNPFCNIYRGMGCHTFRDARIMLYRHYERNDFNVKVIRNVCWDYHLSGECKYGLSCTRATSHRALTPTEALLFESAIEPAIGPCGPIFAAKGHINGGGDTDNSTQGQRGEPHRYSGPNPFQRIAVGGSHSISAIREYLINSCNRNALNGVCLYYHLGGRCLRGDQCDFAHLHRPLSAAKVCEFETAVVPLMGPGGAVETKPPDLPKGQRDKQENGEEDVSICSGGRRQPHREDDDSVLTSLGKKKCPLDNQEGYMKTMEEQENNEAENEVQMDIDKVNSGDLSAINDQPSPFEFIQIGGEHNYDEIYAFLKCRSMPLREALSGLCVRYHLGGFCGQGDSCVFRDCHKPLTHERAYRLEYTLMDLIDMPGGPIKTLEQTAATIHSNIVEQSEYTYIEGCDTPKSIQDTSDTHFLTNLESTSIVSSGIKIKTEPPLVDQLPAKKKMHFFLDFNYSPIASTFGWVHLEGALMSDGRLKKLGVEYQCRLQNDKDRRKICIRGANKQYLSQCFDEMERLLLGGISDSKLRGYLLYNIAIVNRDYRVVKDNVCKCSCSVECKESRFGESTYIKVYGLSEDARGHKLAAGKVLEYKENLMDADDKFANSFIHIFQRSRDFPLIKPFVLVTGSNFSAVRASSKALKSYCSKNG